MVEIDHFEQVLSNGDVAGLNLIKMGIVFDDGMTFGWGLVIALSFDVLFLMVVLVSRLVCWLEM